MWGGQTWCRWPVGCVFFPEAWWAACAVAGGERGGMTETAQQLQSSGVRGHVPICSAGLSLREPRPPWDVSDHPGSAVRGTCAPLRSLTGRDRPHSSVSAVRPGSSEPQDTCQVLPSAQVHSPLKQDLSCLLHGARLCPQSPLSHSACLRAGTLLVPRHLNVSVQVRHSSLVSPVGVVSLDPLTPLLCVRLWGQWDGELRDSKEVSPLQISHICLAAPASVAA